MTSYSFKTATQCTIVYNETQITELFTEHRLCTYIFMKNK